MTEACSTADLMFTRTCNRRSQQNRMRPEPSECGCRFDVELPTRSPTRQDRIENFAIQIKDWPTYNCELQHAAVPLKGLVSQGSSTSSLDTLCAQTMAKWAGSARIFVELVIYIGPPSPHLLRSQRRNRQERRRRRGFLLTLSGSKPFIKPTWRFMLGMVLRYDWGPCNPS